VRVRACAHAGRPPQVALWHSAQVRALMTGGILSGILPRVALCPGHSAAQAGRARAGPNRSTPAGQPRIQARTAVPK